MDDLDLARAGDPAPAEPAVEVRRPASQTTPLVFASPHSGRLYPDEMLAASSLSSAAIRRSEDALVDGLIEGATAFGISLISARYARAYMDVNRDPYELDQAMFEDELPPFARGRSPRVAAGLGAIARVVGDGQEIYDRKLSYADARRRIEGVHHPYHQALASLLQETKARFNRVALIDWHSMPSIAARPSRAGRTPDFVLGDRFGVSCTARLPTLVERELRGLGYEVARNTPYAGGYTTEFYGDPAHDVHVLQVEINRALYLDEAAVAPHAGFPRLKADLTKVFESLARNWTPEL
ncbi:MAG: N-formylglutamate amidohydrolase [Caulobacteraceae bacterium]